MCKSIGVVILLSLFLSIVVEAEAPWNKLLLGAKSMVLPGVDEKQIRDLYGAPAFQDDAGSLWYQIRDVHYERFPDYERFSDGGFVVFRCEERLLVEVCVMKIEKVELKVLSGRAFEAEK